MASTIARNGPNTGAVRGPAAAERTGAASSSALRIVLGECCSWSAISRMVSPSRRSCRIRVKWSTVSILSPLRQNRFRTPGLCYGVSLFDADRVSLSDADYQLHLDHTGITDEGLKQLAALKQLEVLGLNVTKVSDAGLKELTDLQ